jgi:hypothetical protein
MTPKKTIHESLPAILLTTVLVIITISVASADPTFIHGIGDQNNYLPFTPNNFALGTGSVKVSVIDASTGSPIDGATVCDENTGVCGETDELGTYTFPAIRSGYQQFTADVETYFELTRSLIVIANQEHTLLFVLASNDDLSSPGQYRIVVTWNERPPDLDAHLWTGDPTQPHIFQDGRGVCDNPGQTHHCLDRDDQDGIGPETISIIEAQDGWYHFAVQKYEPCFPDPCPEPIESSGAVVYFYDFTGLREAMTVPVSNPENKNFWYVFKFEFLAGVEEPGTFTECFTYMDEPFPPDVGPDPLLCPATP